MGGSTGVHDDAAARLRAAWLRRDIDALGHLFAHCEISSVPLPTLEDSDDLHQAARDALDAMRSQVPNSGVAEGVLATGLYFHALLGWEETDDFDAIFEFVDSAIAVLERLDAEPEFKSVHAARQMLRSIPYQCRTEDARLCACSYSMQLMAAEVADFLGALDIAPRGAHEVDELLLDLVRRDAANAIAFYSLLAEVVGPLAGRFAEVLVDTSGPVAAGLSGPRAELQADIRTALPEVRRVADELSASGEVLGGELAVQADALDRMAAALEAPSLVLDQGQLIYVYPFTVDDAPADGADEARDYRLQLADDEPAIPFRFEHLQRTDAWRSLAGGANGEFRDRGQLVLADGYELRFRPKWIEMEERRGAIAPDSGFHLFDLQVVLGAHGGNYVHLQTQIGEWAGADEPDPWSGAHVDQWVRRLGDDAGADRVSLHRDGELVAEWDTLHEFATAIAAAVLRVERPDAGEAETEPDLTGATVLFVAEAVRVIEPNGTARPLAADEDLKQLTGYSALMASTRYLPASVEEWVRLDAPAPKNLLDGLRPFGDVLLVNGELMALFPLGSPNWVVIEQVEILEFAISLYGYLEHLSEGLREPLRSEEDTGVPATIDEVSRAIHRGNAVLELLRSRRLMRSRYHADLLNRIYTATGARELDARVEKTVEALRDVRRDLEEEQRNRQSHNLDRAVFALTAVTVFIAAHQFALSFFSEDAGAWAEVSVLSIALAATAILALAFRRFRRHFE